MINKKMLAELTTTEKEIKINDMFTLKSFRNVVNSDIIHVNLYFNTGYKYSSAINDSYTLNTESLDSFIESIRAAIAEHGKSITDNMLLHFNKTR